MQEPMLKVAPTQCATLESLHLCTSMLWIYANDEWIAAVGCALHGWPFCGRSCRSFHLRQCQLSKGAVRKAKHATDTATLYFSHRKPDEVSRRYIELSDQILLCIAFLRARVV